MFIISPHVVISSSSHTTFILIIKIYILTDNKFKKILSLKFLKDFFKILFNLKNLQSITIIKISSLQKTGRQSSGNKKNYVYKL